MLWERHWSSRRWVRQRSITRIPRRRLPGRRRSPARDRPPPPPCTRTAGASVVSHTGAGAAWSARAHRPAGRRFIARRAGGPDGQKAPGLGGRERRPARRSYPGAPVFIASRVALTGRPECVEGLAPPTPRETLAGGPRGLSAREVRAPSAASLLRITRGLPYRAAQPVRVGAPVAAAWASRRELVAARARAARRRGGLRRRQYGAGLAAPWRERAVVQARRLIAIGHLRRPSRQRAAVAGQLDADPEVLGIGGEPVGGQAQAAARSLSARCALPDPVAADEPSGAKARAAMTAARIARTGRGMSMERRGTPG